MYYLHFNLDFEFKHDGSTPCLEFPCEPLAKIFAIEIDSNSILRRSRMLIKENFVREI